MRALGTRKCSWCTRLGLPDKKRRRPDKQWRTVVRQAGLMDGLLFLFSLSQDTPLSFLLTEASLSLHSAYAPHVSEKIDARWRQQRDTERRRRPEREEGGEKLPPQLLGVFLLFVFLSLCASLLRLCLCVVLSHSMLSPVPLHSYWRPPRRTAVRTAAGGRQLNERGFRVA